MTLSQVERRLASVERRLKQLAEMLEYQQVIEGIRRGLESADKAEGISLDETLRELQRKHRS